LAQTEISRAEHENLAMAFASRRGSVLSRIKHIQKQKAMKTNFIEGLIAAAVVVTGFMLVSFTVGNRVHTQMLPNEGPVLEATENESGQAAKEWTKQEIDSLKTSVEKQLTEKEDVEDVSEEVERMVEVAMSENDPELQAEIMDEVNRALAEIDIDAVVREAMREASHAIKEAQVEIRTAHEEFDGEEIRRDMEEARRDMEEARREIEEARREVNEEMRRELENAEGMSKEMIELSIQAANAGIDIASAVVNNIDIDAIINGALNGVGAALDALGEIDLDSIEASDTLTQEQIDELEKILEAKEQKLKEEKKKLKAKEKELKNK
jgi:hypothetical protein